MESARLRFFVRIVDLQCLWIRRACDGGAAFAGCVCHTNGKEIHATNRDRRARAQLDLSIVALAQFLKPALSESLRW